MAISGKVNTNSYDSRYIEFAWEVDNRNISTNQTTISWTLTSRGRGEYSQYSGGPFEVRIDGKDVYYSENRITTTPDLELAKGTYVLDHNTDGTKTFSVTVMASVYYKSYNLSGGDSFTLDTIPRAAQLMSAPEFNDEENPKITISNPAGYNVTSLQACISLEGEVDDIKYRDIDKRAKAYTFNLTEDERNILRNATNNGSTKRLVYFILKSVIDGVTYTKSLRRDFTVINCKPLIGIEIWEENGRAFELIGDENVFIKYMSDIGYNVRAYPQKGATIVSYSITCGSFSSSQELATIGSVDDAVIHYSVTDSRGITVSDSIPLNMLNYFAPTVNVVDKMELDGETTAKATLIITGEWFNQSFGEVANALRIGIKTSIDNEWITYSNLITPEFDGNTYRFEITFYEIPYDEDFTYQCHITDLIGYAPMTPERTITLYPVFDWGKSDFNFNVPVSFNGKVMKDFIVEQGTSGIWTYRKWNNGIAECWGTVAPTSHDITNAWGSIYTKDNAIGRQYYPFEFASDPVVSMTLHNTTGNCWAFTGTTGGVSQSPAFGLARGTSGSVVVGARIMAIGRWK